MGMLRAVEDRPTPKEVYNWRLYFEASVIAMGSLLFGYDASFIGTTMARESFRRDFGINSENSDSTSSNIASTFQAAAFFGSIFSYLITERFGRKWALQSSAVVFLIGAVLMTAATNQLSYMYAGRALCGLSCGTITATVPSYIAELSITSIRGILTGLFEVTYQSGTLVGFWINYGINQNMDVMSTASWRVPVAVQMIPAVFLLAGGPFLHESPLWLFRKGKDEKGIKALEELRKLPGDHQYIQEEVRSIRLRLADELEIAKQYGDGSWALFRGVLHELSQKGLRNRVVLVLFLFIFQNVSGAAAINYYSPTLFGSLGIKDVALWTGIYGLIKAVASIIFYGALVDSWGRRNPVLVSSPICSASLFFVGAYVKVGHPASVLAQGGTLSSSTEAGGHAATAMIMVYAAFWSFGLNGIPWIISAEIFPGACRNLTGTYVSLVQWVVQFILTKAMPYMFSSWGYGVWFFLAAWMAIATVYSYFFLPETKGKTLDELDVIFGYNGDRLLAEIQTSKNIEVEKGGMVHEEAPVHR